MKLILDYLKMVMLSGFGVCLAGMTLAGVSASLLERQHIFDSIGYGDVATIIGSVLFLVGLVMLFTGKVLYKKKRK